MIMVYCTECVKSSRPTLTRYNFDKGGSIFMIFSLLTGFVQILEKSGKSWNLKLKFSRSGKSWKMTLGIEKSEEVMENVT